MHNKTRNVNQQN